MREFERKARRNGLAWARASSPPSALLGPAAVGYQTRAGPTLFHRSVNCRNIPGPAPGGRKEVQSRVSSDPFARPMMIRLTNKDHGLHHVKISLQDLHAEIPRQGLAQLTSLAVKAPRRTGSPGFPAPCQTTCDARPARERVSAQSQCDATDSERTIITHS